MAMSVKQAWQSIYSQLNWFRLHLLAYTLIPILFSGFFSAANPSHSSGLFRTNYLDGLFMCMSAMNVTGLNVVSVSQLRPAQQAFLFILMLIGDISVVNLLTISARQYWLRTQCRRVSQSRILEDLHSRSDYSEAEKGGNEPGIEAGEHKDGQGGGKGQGGGGDDGKDKEKKTDKEENQNKDKDTDKGKDKDANKDENKDQGKDDHQDKGRNAGEHDAGKKESGEGERQKQDTGDGGTDNSSRSSDDTRGNADGQSSDNKRDSKANASHRNDDSGNGQSSQNQDQHGEDQPLLGDKEHNPWQEGSRRRQQLRQRAGHKPRSKKGSDDPHGHVPHASSGRSAHSGRGGFPGLDQLIFRIGRHIFPSSISRLSELLKNVESETEHSSHPMRVIAQSIERPFEAHKDTNEQQLASHAKWLPPGVRSVVVGRNSQFFEEELSDEDLELLGALEYRATKILTYLVIAHMLFWVLVPFAIIAIYFAKHRTWESNFISNGGGQSGTVNTTWFAMFQVVSGYSSCGLSLVDELMIPFQNCYLLIWVLLLPILAGNHALPLFLRAEIWLLSKVVRTGSELEVSLHFLLTHARRLFLYLFPAYQSWWLFGSEFFLMALGTICFVAFNHGLPAYMALGSGWEKFSVGLFQVVSSRSSGFDIVYLYNIAPAMVFLYWIFMFTSNYPLVMSIRSTNVYEERALGLHGEHAPHQQNQTQSSGGAVFSQYLKQHLLPQIFFDLWPIALGTLFICVVERGTILNGSNTAWIGIFQILFEATSAYGTIGISYDNPYNTSSLSAEFRKISKLIIILLMLRGRHRGLPLAIDRATMFPVEYIRLVSGDKEKEAEDRVGQAKQEADQE